MSFEKRSELSVAEVNGFDEESLKSILFLEKECFPPDWQYPNADEHYKEVLEDAENINIFLKEDSQVIGYVLARFHNKEMEELKEADPELKEKEDTFYIETVQMLPEKRKMGGLKKLIAAVCEEAERRGVRSFSIHARTVNGLHDAIKNIFEGKITMVRQIESWKYAAGEPYEYIEWHI